MNDCTDENERVVQCSQEIAGLMEARGSGRIKIKYSRLLWAVFGGILAFVLFFGAAPSGVMRPLDSGIPASFGYMTFCGTVIMMFLSSIVGFFFTQEF